MSSFTAVHRRLRRAVLGRRRLLAALFAAIAVAAVLRTVAGPPPPTEPVLTAARDLPSGSVIRGDDLREVAFDPDHVPAGVLDAHDAIGRTTAAPLRAGEPLTDVRLVRASLLRGYPGLVAVPVRIGDADTVDLLRVGDRVDLLAADPQGTEAGLVAAGAAVVALPRRDLESHLGVGEGGGGALVIVAITDKTARRLAQASVSSFITMVIRR